MKNVKELFDLTGKVAIVTGGRGLYGASISRGLFEAGASVVVASRNGEKCKEFAREVDPTGKGVIGLSLDLSSDDSIAEFVGEVVKIFGKIDILVNNAVDRSNMTSLDKATRAKLQDSANTNLTGQLLLSQAVLPHMKEAGAGSIINISSMRGLDSPHFPFYPESMREQPINYTTEKWAMEGMTKFMACRYGKDGIRVNSIAPGGFNPGLATKNEAGKQFTETYVENCPLGKWAGEDDIKGCVVFLASEASAYVTGATLVMDGGWTVW